MKKNAFTNFIDDFKTFIKTVKKSDKKIKMVIPNLLTASRILAPFCILPATLTGNFPLAVTFAAAFAVTDAFDGFLARRWNATSEFGRNLDPICDKFFALGVIIPFINNPQMILTLVLEGVIAGVNLKSAFKNNKPKSTYLGKGKTILLSLLIVMSYLFKLKGISLDALLPLVIITNVTQAITAIDYMHIDNKKDIKKEVEKIVETKEIPENESENKELENNYQVSKYRKEIIEYTHLKESFQNEKELQEKDIDEDTKRRHFNL